MRSWTIIPAAFALLLLPRAARAQDASLACSLTLELGRVRTAESGSLSYVVQFSNLLAEPLRWHPRAPFDPTAFVATVCFTSSDGRHYIAYTDQEGDGPSDVTAVLPARASAFASYTFWQFLQTDENWNILPNTVPDTPDAFQYQGPLPVGSYSVSLRYWDGPALSKHFPERAPAAGIYRSPPVQLKVVSDDSPVDQHPLYSQPTFTIHEDPLEAGIGGGPTPRCQFKLKGVELVDARLLGRLGVRLTTGGNGIVLARAKKTVTLPVSHLTRGFTPARDGPPVPALAIATRNSGTHYLVPARYVVKRLGLAARLSARPHTMQAPKPQTGNQLVGNSDRR